MKRVLRVLIVGDRVDNAESICRELGRAGFVLESQRVETETDYLAALHPELDVIIVDHHLFGFDATRALALMKERALEVPVIVVSGIAGEELAVRMMQEGAADYLLKSHLARLATAVQRVLEQPQPESSLPLIAGTALSNEEQARLLLESATEGVLGLDAKGVCSFANPSAMRLLGCTSTLDMVGKHLHVLMHGQAAPETSCATDDTCICGQLCQDRDVHVKEETLRQADGGALLVEFRSHPIRHADQIVGHLVTLHDFTERRRIEREVLEVGERERARLGQDLHDRLGQDMTALVCVIESLGRKLRDRVAPEVDQLPKIQELMKNIVLEIRGLSRSLRPASIERSGLSAALVELTTSVGHTTGTTCEFDSQGPIQVDGDTATHLYGIVQEALSNASHHANARNIRVMLKNIEHGIALTVRDDGTPGETDRAEELGLRTMAYRARIIGGDLHVARGPEGGTVVECVVATDRNQGLMKPLGGWRAAPRPADAEPQKTGQMAKA